MKDFSSDKDRTVFGIIDFVKQVIKSFNKPNIRVSMKTYDH